MTTPGRDVLVAGLRRGVWAYALGAVLLLLAVPAVDDLDALCRTLGFVAIAVGVLVTLATLAPSRR